MKKFLAEITFNMDDENFILNLCDHNDYMQLLLDKTILLVYVAGNDSPRIWAIIKEVNKFEAEQHMLKSPLAPCFNIHIEELQDFRCNFLYKKIEADPDLIIAKHNQN